MTSVPFLQARDRLKTENERLKLMLKSKSDETAILKSQVGMIQKNTVSFILEQMEALNIQRDTHVWLVARSPRQAQSSPDHMISKQEPVKWYSFLCYRKNHSSDIHLFSVTEVNKNKPV